MKNFYTKPHGYGAWTPKRLVGHLNSGVGRKGGSIRPIPYTSIIERLRYAWDILTYKCDPLYWKEPNE